MLLTDGKSIVYHKVIRRCPWISREDGPVQQSKGGLHPKIIPLSVWRNIQWIVLQELSDVNETITSNLFSNQFRRLKSALLTERKSFSIMLTLDLKQLNWLKFSYWNLVWKIASFFSILLTCSYILFVLEITELFGWFQVEIKKEVKNDFILQQKTTNKS